MAADLFDITYMLLQNQSKIYIYCLKDSKLSLGRYSSRPVFAAHHAFRLELTIRVEHSRQKSSIFSMDNVAKDFDWTVTVPHARIDVSAFIHDAIECVHQVQKADSLVHIDSAIMNGMPVFWGTRVPIDTITASLDKGIDKERLISSYPFLTDEHIEAARTYAKVHPKRGRPRRLSEANPTWEVKSVRVVRATKA